MPDHRTAAELVADGDALARELLLDVSADRGPAMVRSWVEVVQAAARLWTVIPVEATTGPADMDIMHRLHALGAGIGRSTTGGGWPGQGPLDERLLKIGGNLTQAAVLTRGDVRSGPAAAPDGEPDAAELRGQVVHTLYLTAHGTGVALTDYANELERRLHNDFRQRRSLSERPNPADATAARDLVARLRGFEQVAGNWLAAHPDTPGPGPGTGRSYGLVAPMTRLESVLAGWDVQAHRTLAWNPDTPDLVRVARVQALIAATTNVISQAAAHQGFADPGVVQRLTPILNQAEAAWISTAKRWGELTGPVSRTDPALTRAAGQIRAAIGATACTKTRWATPDQLANRLNLTQTLSALQLGTASAVDLAYLSREVAATRRLTAPARAVGRRAQADIVSDQTVTTNLGTTWATSQEIRTNQMVPLPGLVRQGLVSLATDVIAMSNQVAAAAAPLQPGPTLREPSKPRDVARSSNNLRVPVNRLGPEGPRP